MVRRSVISAAPQDHSSTIHASWPLRSHFVADNQPVCSSTGAVDSTPAASTEKSNGAGGAAAATSGAPDAAIMCDTTLASGSAAHSRCSANVAPQPINRPCHRKFSSAQPMAGTRAGSTLLMNGYRPGMGCCGYCGYCGCCG